MLCVVLWESPRGDDDGAEVIVNWTLGVVRFLLGPGWIACLSFVVVKFFMLFSIVVHQLLPNYGVDYYQGEGLVVHVICRLSDLES